MLVCGVVVLVVLVVVTTLAAMKHCALCFQNLSTKHIWGGVKERSPLGPPTPRQVSSGFSWTKGEAPPWIRDCNSVESPGQNWTLIW